MTAAVVLAAGGSTRLGYPKQLVRLGGETLLERAVRMAREAGCCPVLVVLGASAGEIEQSCCLHDAEVVINGEWREGMASSIRHGIASLARRQVSGAIILPCDMPAIMPTHLQALAAVGTTTASRYAQRNGVPAYFVSDDFDLLLNLTGDAGARNLLESAHFIDLRDGELDIDLPEHVSRMRLVVTDGRKSA